MKKEKIINIGKIEFHLLELLNQINTDQQIIVLTINMEAQVETLVEAHLKINMEVLQIRIQIQIIKNIKKMEIQGTIIPLLREKK